MTIMETVPQRVRARATRHAMSVATYSKNRVGVFQPQTYGELWQTVTEVGAGLLSMGIGRGEHVGMISDNRREWLVLDLALLAIGAVDVPRGNDATVDEIACILNHADCAVTIAENRTQADKILQRIRDLPNLRRIVLIDDDKGFRKPARKAGIDVISLQEVRDRGLDASLEQPERFLEELEAGNADDIATILYTSGTTGEPKGVMLTHRSYIFQMDRIRNILFLDTRDIFLSVLPIWHSFERAVEYIVLNCNAAIAYSKPIGQVMLEDMATIRPTWMISVPRIWEGMHTAVFRSARKEKPLKQLLFHTLVGIGQFYAVLTNMLLGRLPQFRRRSRPLDIALAVVPLIVLLPFKLLGDQLVFKRLKRRLGGRFVAGVSGGGALPANVDNFFQAAGIKLLEGYGLTETGPILAVRLQRAPVPGTVGPLLPDIQFRILGEDGRVLPRDKKGVLWVKSEQIMRGYYKRPEETAAVLHQGWLNTGDLAVQTYNGELRILGRVKDTIVLLGGENIEPGPIEEKLTQSEYIDQAMVVGQDQKFLGALLSPNLEMLEVFAGIYGIEDYNPGDLMEHPEFIAQIRREIDGLINAKNGFKPYEHIYRFGLLSKPFEPGRELTGTMKIRRNVVYDLYKRDIERLFR
ncbi:MAG: long-chain fatty acid--CoA ligase [Spirochaetaceae bacterium]|nr:MAG: long-chain fatty acid--CoA ligase [Spirochaetaceae bacterium]